MGKFYYCGISTVRRQIKNPRTPHKRKFNFLLRVVILFYFYFHRWYHNSKIEGLNHIEVLCSLYIYLLKISCRIRRFLTEWYFLAKVFPRQVPKISCHMICTIQDLSSKLFYCYYECKQENKFYNAFQKQNIHNTLHTNTKCFHSTRQCKDYIQYNYTLKYNKLYKQWQRTKR